MSLPVTEQQKTKITSTTNTNFTSVANTEFIHYNTMSNHPIPGLAAEAVDYGR